MQKNIHTVSDYACISSVKYHLQGMHITSETM